MENTMGHPTSPAEERELKLQQLIDARITATENDILTKRGTIVRAVAELCAGLKCDEDEAEALVRAAVIGRSFLVGPRIAEEVQHAIYRHVLPLAEADLADVERNLVQAAQHDRIERRVWARFFSRVTA
jgi:hypothetical protein